MAETYGFSSAADPDVNHWRRQNYSPLVVYDADGSVGKITEVLGDLMEQSRVGRTHSVDRGVTWRSYEQTFPEPLSVEGSDGMLAHVEILHRIYPAPGVERETWDTSIRYWDGTASEEYSAKSCKLKIFAGGVASLRVQESLDGVGSALVNEDARFLADVKWRDATQHDAVLLAKELGHLRKIQAEIPRVDPQSVPVYKRLMI